MLKKIAKFIQEQNDKIYAPRGLLLTDPIERGLRVVSLAPPPSPGPPANHCLQLCFHHPQNGAKPKCVNKTWGWKLKLSWEKPLQYG